MFSHNFGSRAVCSTTYRAGNTFEPRPSSSDIETGPVAMKSGLLSGCLVLQSVSVVASVATASGAPEIVFGSEACGA